MQNEDLTVPRDEYVRKGARRFVIKTVVFLIIMPHMLFWPAGSWTWIQGWVLVGLSVLINAVTIALLLPRSPDLLAERANRHKGMKRWDIALTGPAAAYLPMLSWILGALDFRYAWTGPLPVWVPISGAIAIAVGSAIILWSMVTNAFFSAIIRIQTDRGHRVIDTGPYAIVRHPGYVGWLLVTAGTPLLLASFWAAVPMATALILIVIRTVLEDRTLHRELCGYSDYAKRTRHKLCPGIW